VADNPREGMTLTNPARDQLDVLGTEIEDQNRTRRGVGIRHGWFLRNQPCGVILSIPFEGNECTNLSTAATIRSHAVKGSASRK
jgi:hypothetical protein